MPLLFIARALVCTAKDIVIETPYWVSHRFSGIRSLCLVVLEFMARSLGFSLIPTIPEQIMIPRPPGTACETTGMQLRIKIGVGQSHRGDTGYTGRY